MEDDGVAMITERILLHHHINLQNLTHQQKKSTKWQQWPHMLDTTKGIFMSQDWQVMHVQFNYQHQQLNTFGALIICTSEFTFSGKLTEKCSHIDVRHLGSVKATWSLFKTSKINPIKENMENHIYGLLIFHFSGEQM